MYTSIISGIRRKWWLFFLMVINLPTLLFSQEPDVIWEKRYGGVNYDRFYSVKPTSDGNFICVGGTFSYVGEQVYAAKIDQDGTIIWAGPYGNTTGWDVVESDDGNYIIVGDSPSPRFCIFLMSIDGSGTIQWERKFGGSSCSRGYEIQKTMDGGYIVIGMDIRESGWDKQDVYLVKTDANGHVEWSKSYGGSQRDEGISVKQTWDGGFIIAGYTNSYGAGSFDGYLIKTDSDGNKIWEETYGDVGYECFASLRITDNGYALAGYTQSVGAGGVDYYLVKTDFDGNVYWEKTYGGTSDDWCYHHCTTENGGFILSGRSYSFGGAYVVGTDENGDIIWSKSFTSTNNGGGSAVEPLTDGGLIIAGTYGPSDDDAYLIRLGSLSRSISIDIKPGSDENPINLKSNGNIPVAIITTSIANGDEFDFDATTVDPLSVEFGPDGAKECHGRGHIEDFDHDGDLDMVLHFRTQETGIQSGDVEAILTGSTYEGINISGSDIITVRGGKLKKTFSNNMNTNMPESYFIHQNYPNPFNPSTIIQFGIPTEEYVSIEIFNISGKKVRSLSTGVISAGYHEVMWDGKNDNGIQIPTGIYFCKISSRNFQKNIRMLYIK